MITKRLPCTTLFAGAIMLYDVDSSEAFHYKLLDYSIYTDTIPFEFGTIAGVMAMFLPCSFV